MALSFSSSPDQTFFNYTLVSLLLSSPLSFLSLQFLSAPYGKHRRPGWGPLLYPPLAWFLMESPTLSLSLLLFPLGRNRLEWKAGAVFVPFVVHYFHRVFVYPLRLHLLNRRRNGGFKKGDDRNTALGKWVDRNTAFGKIAYGEKADSKTQYGETSDRVFDDSWNTTYGKRDDWNTADRNTDYGKNDDSKTQYSEINDRVVDDRRNTAFGKSDDRETLRRETDDGFVDDWKTADSETQYSDRSNTAVRRNTADRKTVDLKASNSETVDRFIDDRKTQYSETIDQAIDNRKAASGFPASIAAMAFAYNVWNTYIQARWVSHYADFDSDEWFWWRFCVGIAVFVIGMAINVWSDLVLLDLKAKGGGYKVPKGGLFEFVSCPNYFGEVVEWLGWAVMTWSWAGIGFFLFTCSNLVPRACSHHKWYLEKFGKDYPKKRKAVIPFLY